MDFLQSMFGAYAEAKTLQAIIDRSNAKFNLPFWNRYFSVGVPSMVLTYVTALGKTRLDAAASLVSRNARTPLRSRANLGKLTGSIPAIKVMKTLDEDDYRSYLTFQALQIADTTKKAQLLDLLFGDIASTVNSINKRLDYMTLEGLSTGFITVTADNNPDGVILDTLDLLVPNNNFVGVSAIWKNVDGTPNAAALPITDLRNLVNYITALGKHVDTIFISFSMFQVFITNPEVISTLKGFFNPGSNQRYTGTLDTINAYLTAMQYPTFTILNEVVMIEKDGANHMYRPFKDANVVLVPAGNLGEIKNALAVEELQPVTNVGYSKQGNILVSKWFANEPFGEYTKAEWNAFPSFDSVIETFIMETDTVGVIPALPINL